MPTARYLKLAFSFGTTNIFSILNTHNPGKNNGRIEEYKITVECFAFAAALKWIQERVIFKKFICFVVNYAFVCY